MRDRSNCLESSDALHRYGSVVRVRTTYVRFSVARPYDVNDVRTAYGTAFLCRIRETPFIVTAHHVVRNARRIQVSIPTMVEGEMRDAQLIGYNPHLDVAILHAPEEFRALPAFEWGRSSDLCFESQIKVLGYAGGTLRLHTTLGAVSGRRGWPHHRIQTHTTINPGNSGGPVLDAEQQRVVGIVTSSSNDMENTNFFTGSDEARRVFDRILRSNREGPDMGFHLDAVLQPVDAAAAMHSCGGMRVVCTMPHTGLQPGDLITEASDRDGKMVGVNTRGRSLIGTIWKGDELDVRTILDTLDCKEGHDQTTWKLKVVRNGVPVTVDAGVQPQRMAMRALRPDCEPVRYVVFGGLILQMESVSHHISSKCDVQFQDPRTPLDSRVVISHVLPGSPFDAHDEVSLKGARIVRVIDASGKGHRIRGLDDIAGGGYPVLELETGERVGTSLELLRAYEELSQDAALTPGKHAVAFSLAEKREKSEKREKREESEKREKSEERKRKASPRQSALAALSALAASVASDGQTVEATRYRPATRFVLLKRDTGLSGIGRA